MRPVNKGLAPQIYINYLQAKDDLRDVIGSYCSYCELNISNGMDIEHISPKSKNPEIENAWENLLVACKICNRNKSNNNDNRDGYIFPDTHNTAYAFKYTKTKVLINDDLNDEEKILAQNTITLVKINRENDSQNRIDDRLYHRIREWDKAEDSLKDYLKNSSQEMINQITRSHTHFISSWLEIFKSYPEVKKALLESIAGTNFRCYDDDFNAVRSLER